MGGYPATDKIKIYLWRTDRLHALYAGSFGEHTTMKINIDTDKLIENISLHLKLAKLAMSAAETPTLIDGLESAVIAATQCNLCVEHSNAFPNDADLSRFSQWRGEARNMIAHYERKLNAQSAQATSLRESAVMPRETLRKKETKQRRAPLTESKAREILDALAKRTGTIAEISEAYDVGESTIYALKSGTIFAYLSGSGE